MQADRTTTTVMPVVALEPKVFGITHCRISCCGLPKVFYNRRGMWHVPTSGSKTR